MMGVSIVILAGGEGSRIGGGKGLRLLRDKPLIAWVLDAVRAQGDEVLISANELGYAGFGCPVIADEQRGMGPLAGLQAALLHASHDLVMAVPCDAPFLPSDLCARLKEALGEADAAVALVGGRRQPAIALYHKQVLPRLDAWLAAGERRVGGWLDTLCLHEVAFADEAAFANINTASELEAVSHRLADGKAAVRE